MSADEEALPFDLTPKDLAIYQHAFDQIDREGDGVVNFADLPVALRIAMPQASDQDVEAILRNVEHADDGLICFYEFAKILSMATKVRSLDEITKDVFRRFDRTQDGFISVADLGSMFTRLGEKVPAEDLERMIVSAGGTREDGLRYRDFVKLNDRLRQQ